MTQCNELIASSRNAIGAVRAPYMGFHIDTQSLDGAMSVKTESKGS